MRILFNHNISGAADLIDLMRRARPGLHVIATHERRDTPIALAADRLLPEPAETRLMSPDAYADWLLQVALAEGAELVLPYRRREELARLVAQTFRLTGILNLQTIEDRAGTQRLMEVNTRASGGIGMTGLTDVNLPALLLDSVDGVRSDLSARVTGEVQAGRRELFWGV